MMAKRNWLILILATGLGMMPHGAWAYQKDVHFNLTYVLCRMIGIKDIDALWIADADQSMDDNDSTSCFYNNKPPTHWQHNGKMWHDFSDGNKKSGDTTYGYKFVTIQYKDGGALARSLILSRLKTLWNTAEQAAKKYHSDHEDKSRIMADIAMGQYLHAEQDYFSHRQFTDGYLKADKYLPYGPKAGHIHDGDKSYADYVALRPALAYLMAQDSFVRLSQYNYYLFRSNEIGGLSLLLEYAKKYLNSLVNALASTYTKPNPMPANYYTEPEATTVRTFDGGAFYEVSPPLSQEKINHALQNALATFPAPIAWRGSLPEYNEDDKLPFDDQMMSLEAVKARVKQLSKESSP